VKSLAGSALIGQSGAVPETPDDAGTCFICDKHTLGDATQGGILYTDDLLFAGHVHTTERQFAYRGWLVVEPRRHVPDLGDLTDDEASGIGKLANQLARLLKEALGAEHVYAFAFGDNFPHLHVHVVPRYPNTPREYWGLRLRDWPNAPRVDEQEMRTLVSTLRTQLEAR
jgi:diadenosine tetraphosphate (Ap4A) HIT family hydrolase